MKAKIVVKASMNCQKSRSKALKISVGVSGVESASLKDDQLEVVGEGIDAVELIRQLRKSMAHAELVSVGEVKKEENPAPAAKAVTPDPQPPLVWTYLPPHNGFVNYPCYEMRAPSYEPGCAIM